MACAIRSTSDGLRAFAAFHGRDDARAAFVNKVAFVAAAYGYGEAHKQQTFPISRIAHQPSDLRALLH